MAGATGLSEYVEWALVCQRVPHAVICLLSSLRYFQVGLQDPHKLWIALPAGYHAPVLSYPPLSIIRPVKNVHEEGVLVVTIEGLPMKIYSLEKTIADCFKYRNRIGIETAIQAQKEAWNKKLIDLNSLWKYAKINRVLITMQPYLDILE